MNRLKLNADTDDIISFIKNGFLINNKKDVCKILGIAEDSSDIAIEKQIINFKNILITKLKDKKVTPKDTSNIINLINQIEEINTGYSDDEIKQEKENIVKESIKDLLKDFECEKDLSNLSLDNLKNESKNIINEYKTNISNNLSSKGVTVSSSNTLKYLINKIKDIKLENVTTVEGHTDNEFKNYIDEILKVLDSTETTSDKSLDESKKLPKEVVNEYKTSISNNLSSKGVSAPTSSYTLKGLISKIKDIKLENVTTVEGHTDDEFKNYIDEILKVLDSVDFTSGKSLDESKKLPKEIVDNYKKDISSNLSSKGITVSSSNTFKYLINKINDIKTENPEKMKENIKDILKSLDIEIDIDNKDINEIKNNINNKNNDLKEKLKNLLKTKDIDIEVSNIDEMIDNISKIETIDKDTLSEISNLINVSNCKEKEILDFIKEIKTQLLKIKNYEVEINDNDDIKELIKKYDDLVLTLMKDWNNFIGYEYDNESPMTMLFLNCVEIKDSLVSNLKEKNILSKNTETLNDLIDKIKQIETINTKGAKINFSNVETKFKKIYKKECDEISDYKVDNDENVYMISEKGYKKYDKNFNLVWDITSLSGYSSGYSRKLICCNNEYSIIRTSDGITKFDKNGNKIWEITIKDDSYYCSDNKYLYVSNYDGHVIKINNENGNTVWECSSVLSSRRNNIEGMTVDKDDNLFIITSEYSLVKLDKYGSVDWKHKLNVEPEKISYSSYYDLIYVDNDYSRSSTNKQISVFDCDGTEQTGFSNVSGSSYYELELDTLHRYTVLYGSGNSCITIYCDRLNDLQNSWKYDNNNPDGPGELRVDNNGNFYHNYQDKNDKKHYIEKVNCYCEMI